MYNNYNNRFDEQSISFLNNLQNGIVIFELDEDNNPSFAFINDLVPGFLGYETDEICEYLIGDPFYCLYPSDRDTFSNLYQKFSESDIVAATYRLVKKDGSQIWVLGHHKIQTYKGTRFLSISYTNVQDLIGVQIKLQEANDKWFDIVSSMPVGIAIFSKEVDSDTFSTIAVNDTLVSFSNAVGKELDGNARVWSASELTMLLNQNIYSFCIAEDERLVLNMLTNSESGKFTDCLFRLRGSNDQKTVWIKSYCGSKMVSDTVRNYYVSFQDMTKTIEQQLELKKNHEMLYKLSIHDALTGVYNRHAYEEVMTYTKNNRQSNVGIAFADINGLKATNDSLGHSYGDGLIKKFVEIARKYFPPEQIYRISGDEFVIIEFDISKSDFKNKMMSLIYDCGQANNVASIGYVWKSNVSDIKRRVAQAEKIMYLEKQRYYELTSATESKHRPEMLKRLNNDIANGCFHMFLQPKVSIDGQHIVGAEALVRKIDDDGKIIPPFEFIPQLEKEHLISKIDYFILEEACKFLEMCKEKGDTVFSLSVNMSRVTMADIEYMDEVNRICDKYDFNRNQLDFEITESTETIDNVRLEEYIISLKEFGSTISLDDVGTDYSSLPMLVIDGIDTVKLDRSCIINYSQPKVGIMLKYLIEMCHMINLRVVAEGVETEECRRALAEYNCDIYQGYLMSKPIPVDEFIDKFKLFK